MIKNERDKKNKEDFEKVGEFMDAISRPKAWAGIGELCFFQRTEGRCDKHQFIFPRRYNNRGNIR